MSILNSISKLFLHLKKNKPSMPQVEDVEPEKTSKRQKKSHQRIFPIKSDETWIEGKKDKSARNIGPFSY